MTGSEGTAPPESYRIRACHISERLRLKDVRDRLERPPREFSNYELVIEFSPVSFVFVYNYGSLVFFNVPEDVQESILAKLSTFRSATDFARTTDSFSVEVTPDAGTGSKVFFDRIITHTLTYEKIKIGCMLLGESTALEYYEILIENLLEKANTYSKKLETEGRLLQSGEEFIKFIGMCLSTKQEIISNLYIVDSPDETWENVELDRIFQDLKTLMEIDIRYRALDYKIRIIQDSLELMVDLSKSRRDATLELTIILLIAFEIVLSLFKFA
ncbi:MAG: RMD1 family protein [Bdellovibrionota bacterium]